MRTSAFKLVSPFKPTGDQPEAIKALCDGLEKGKKYQVLEGVTGSGKTFTLANIIERYEHPVLVISHNKTLAAQLYSELKSFFPHNAVEYFISYYDYYQPEAYIPETDTYIEKDAYINKEIERLRLSATNSLLMRNDVIIVASVSCIYGLGSPEDYAEMLVYIKKNATVVRDEILRKLVDIQYQRNDYETAPGTFRVRGDTIEIFPSYEVTAIRVDFMGDTVECITEIDTLTKHPIHELDEISISPAKHFVVPEPKIQRAIQEILKELDERVKYFESQNKLLEAQRLYTRTMYDVEMLREVGYCAGIENYSRHLSGRKPGEPPATLLDYFPNPFLTIIDESHVTVPQLRGMYNADISRKKTLVEHGFRLPSALDNRPLCFEEFMSKVSFVIFNSATPDEFELGLAGTAVRQIVRPTGLVDPPVEVRPLKNQIDDAMEEIRAHAERGERVLVTTLTKRTAEDLAEYLRDSGLRVEYIHSEIDAIERVSILRRLRLGEFDCLVGINLLREGLDLPEVALVAILDADKEGFLRSETALIQIAGRTARHINGKVILYADTLTDSIKKMIAIVEERRKIQLEYNKKHNITPTSIKKGIKEELLIRETSREVEKCIVRESGVDYDIYKTIEELEQEMLEAAQALEFERAAILRDEIRELKIISNQQKIAPITNRTQSRSRRKTLTQKRKGKTLRKL